MYDVKIEECECWLVFALTWVYLNLLKKFSYEQLIKTLIRYNVTIRVVLTRLRSSVV